MSLGIIGDRQLLCVQTFDIARHPSTAVGLIPGCFVAVSGKGPRDANESGKTSWLASVALLLGDPEWRMHSSGPATVADLLFEPQTAGVAAQGYAPATSGYIAGLFAAPDDVASTAHTVWMKLSATPTYVEVRHAPGVYLATAQDDDERHHQATEIYRGLPSASSLGATQYATALYGPVPRCLASLTSRGKRRGGPSLLKLDTGLFTPAGIGTALIGLTGRASLLDTDAALRHDLSEAGHELQTSQTEDADSHAIEERTLRAVTQRSSAREELARAQDLWALHYARGLLDALERAEQLQAALDDQAETLARARDERASAEAVQHALEDPTRLGHQRDEAELAKQTAERLLDQAHDDECSARHRLASHNQALQEAEDAAAGARGISTMPASRRNGPISARSPARSAWPRPASGFRTPATTSPRPKKDATAPPDGRSAHWARQESAPRACSTGSACPARSARHGSRAWRCTATPCASGHPTSPPPAEPWPTSRAPS
ncbi:hypothetical protein ACFQ0G_11525 [Streptomyces chiangmaiensis]